MYTYLKVAAWLSSPPAVPAAFSINSMVSTNHLLQGRSRGFFRRFWGVIRGPGLKYKSFGFVEDPLVPTDDNYSIYTSTDSDSLAIGTDTITHLPREVLAHFLTFLDLDSIIAWSAVSRAWRGLLSPPPPFLAINKLLLSLPDAEQLAAGEFDLDGLIERLTEALNNSPQRNEILRLTGHAAEVIIECLDKVNEMSRIVFLVLSPHRILGLLVQRC